MSWEAAVASPARPLESAAEAIPPAPPGVELLLYPERFFRDRFPRWMAGGGLPPLLAAIYVFGVSNALDRMWLRVTLGRGQLPESWTSYWLPSLAIACISGPFGYAIGGFWFRLRMLWCKADIDMTPASRAFLATELVAAVPTVIVALAETLVYATPDEAWQGNRLWWLVPGMKAWCLYVRYAAARVLGASRRRALGWFVVGPAIVLTAAMGGGIYASLKGLLS